MEPTSSPDPAEALARAESARAATAARTISPWWYYPGIGLFLLFAFATVSLDRDMIPFGVVLGIGLGPLLLTTLLRNATGVWVDRFYATPGTRRISSWYGPAIIALAVVGLLLEWVADLRGAMAVAGLVAFAVTVLAGRRLDAVLVRDLSGPA
jgi:hypothetical protein